MGSRRNPPRSENEGGGPGSRPKHPPVRIFTGHLLRKALMGRILKGVHLGITSPI